MVSLWNSLTMLSNRYIYCISLLQAVTQQILIAFPLTNKLVIGFESRREKVK